MNPADAGAAAGVGGKGAGLGGGAGGVGGGSGGSVCGNMLMPADALAAADHVGSCEQLGCQYRIMSPDACSADAGGWAECVQ